MTAALSVSRAKDRALMAEQIASLARSLGAEATIKSAPLGDRDLWVNVQTTRGLCLTVSLDGDSRQCRDGTFVLPWYIALKSDALLDPSFGNVNPYHFGKATQVAYSFPALLTNLECGLTKARDGSAFKG